LCVECVFRLWRLQYQWSRCPKPSNCLRLRNSAAETIWNSRRCRTCWRKYGSSTVPHVFFYCSFIVLLLFLLSLSCFCMVLLWLFVNVSFEIRYLYFHMFILNIFICVWGALSNRLIIFQSSSANRPALRAAAVDGGHRLPPFLAVIPHVSLPLSFISLLSRVSLCQSISHFLFLYLSFSLFLCLSLFISLSLFRLYCC
jgi:hypothetical protein